MGSRRVGIAWPSRYDRSKRASRCCISRREEGMRRKQAIPAPASQHALTRDGCLTRRGGRQVWPSRLDLPQARSRSIVEAGPAARARASLADGSSGDPCIRKDRTPSQEGCPRHPSSGTLSPLRYP
eukprot:scaffold20011_cov33-Tisochrysis_lutea.AAC.2